MEVQFYITILFVTHFSEKLILFRRQHYLLCGKNHMIKRRDHVINTIARVM